MEISHRKANVSTRTQLSRFSITVATVTHLSELGVIGILGEEINFLLTVFQRLEL